MEAVETGSKRGERERGKEGQPRKMLFGCRANACRSPMAEAILDPWY
jgi:hypothetical protein